MINNLAIKNQTEQSNNNSKNNPNQYQRDDNCDDKRTPIDKVNNFIPICLTSLFIFTFTDVFKTFFNWLEGDNKYWFLNKLITIFIILNLYLLYYLN